MQLNLTVKCRTNRIMRQRYFFDSVSGQLPKWTPSRMTEGTIPNGHNPKWTQSRMDTTPNGHHPEWTQSRKDTIPHGHNPEGHNSKLLKYFICKPDKEFLQKGV